MFLKKISLLNFRNYVKRELVIGGHGCLVLGGNATGKTNFLEAVYLLAAGKSFRAGREKEMILWGEEWGKIEAEVEIDGEREKLEVVVTGRKGRRGGKRFLINGVGKRQVDFVGKFAAVLFWPEDLEMITSGPSLRRRYLNRVLTLVDRDYRVSLAAYKRGLRQRNRILGKIREGKGRGEQLYFWDRLLIKNGSVITKKREEFIDFLNRRVDVFHDLEIFYDKSIISESRLKKYEREEVLAGVTLVGPHRDDFKVGSKINKKKIGEGLVNGVDFEGEKFVDLQIYGSRGEQRLAVLALKLCEVEYLAEKFGERPILLLDDIFSELDSEHRELVLAKIFNQQTIMTATDKSVLAKKYFDKIEIVKI